MFFMEHSVVQSGYYLLSTYYTNLLFTYLPRLCSPAPTGLLVEAVPLPQLPREFLNLGSRSRGFPTGFYHSHSRAKH